ARLRAVSREFLVPWEPVLGSDDLTKPAFRRRVRSYNRDIRNDQAYPFFIFGAGNNILLGGITLSNIRRSVAQSACTMGYWIGRPFRRQGYMAGAVQTILPYAFTTLRLHRIEAACLPHNQPSIGLLSKCGFVREGQARSYLCINGDWQDHVLFALIEDDLRRAARSTATKGNPGAGYLRHVDQVG
ncbi:MAG: GNAT family N-acetyltransferase, partial [Hyphomicrobiales bacterium]